jgi:hypothetical protein
MRRSLFALSLACIFIGNLVAPSAKAAAVSESFNTRQPITSEVFNDPCGIGERVQINGILHRWGHITVDSATGAVVIVHTRFEDITAVGETTGASYGYSEKQLFVVRETGATFPLVSTQMVVFRLTGPSGAYRLQILYHLTVNGLGEVSTEVDRATLHCL